MSARILFSRLIKFSLYMATFMIAAGLGAYLVIHLLIKSESHVVVPELMGKDVVYALEVLSDLKLNTKVKGSYYSDNVPKHHIIDQEPEPGTEIKQGRDIRLMISKGPHVVIYPDLVGLDLPMVSILLEENDLRQGNLSYVYDPDRPKEEILAQVPAAGEKGRRKSPVHLLISAGPRPHRLRMENLKGLRIDQAIDMIEESGMTIGTISQVQQTQMPDNIVMAHTPSMGNPVLAGDAVDLTVNRLFHNTKAVHRQRLSIFRYRLSPGFLRQHVRVRIIRQDGACEIYNDFAKPGEEIWLGILRDLPTALFLYLEDELIMTKNFD
jgi:beta-lactam-binding protein with PASTA domain